MAAPPAWVAALPSDDDDEEDHDIVETTVSEPEVVIPEDDDVQVVNVVKFERQRPHPSAEGAVRGVKVNDLSVLQHSMDFLGDAHRQSVPAMPRHHGHHHHNQQVSPSPRKRKRNEMQQQQRIQTSANWENLHYTPGLLGPPPMPHFTMERGLLRGPEPMLEVWRQQEFSGRGLPYAPVVPQENYYRNVAAPRLRDFGILGGGPASQLRERETIARASGLPFREQGFLLPQERGPILAPTGCERLLVPQRYNHHVQFVEQEKFDIVRAPGHGTPIATPCKSLERMVTGNTMDEWWSSLRENMGTNTSTLHWNIINFCKAYEISPQQMQMRREALNYIEQTVHEHWPNAEVHLFGSTATGLALPWSDIDVAVMSSPHHDNNYRDPKSATMLWMTALSKQLRRRGQVQSLVKIPHAKVPVMKVVFKSGLSCDISLDSHNGPKGVPVIRHFMQQYEALHPLCLVLKFFLGQQNLNELYTGGLGSFCLITMVVSHLQKLGVTGTGHDLGAILLSFFTQYGTMHDYRNDVVSTRGTEVCASKQAKGWVNLKDPELLSVEDPLDPTSDIAKGSYRIQVVRTKFLKAKSVLLAHWDHDDVLGMLVNMTGNRNQRPKAQLGETQVIMQPKQPKQKKRKQIDMSGGEMENGQPVKMLRKQKKPGGLPGSRAKKKKNKLKKEDKRGAAGNEGRTERKVKGKAKRAKEKHWISNSNLKSNSGGDFRR